MTLTTIILLVLVLYMVQIFLRYWRWSGAATRVGRPMRH
jgi:hypothetical protein